MRNTEILCSDRDDLSSDLTPQHTVISTDYSAAVLLSWSAGLNKTHTQDTTNNTEKAPIYFNGQSKPRNNVRCQDKQQKSIIQVKQWTIEQSVGILTRPPRPETLYRNLILDITEVNK